MSQPELSRRSGHPYAYKDLFGRLTFFPCFPPILWPYTTSASRGVCTVSMLAMDSCRPPYTADNSLHGATSSMRVCVVGHPARRTMIPLPSCPPLPALLACMRALGQTSRHRPRRCQCRCRQQQSSPTRGSVGNTCRRSCCHLHHPTRQCTIPSKELRPSLSAHV